MTDSGWSQLQIHQEFKIQSLSAIWHMYATLLSSLNPNISDLLTSDYCAWRGKIAKSDSSILLNRVSETVSGLSINNSGLKWVSKTLVHQIKNPFVFSTLQILVADSEFLLEFD
ncbi:hypothetical protein L1987_79646 [Smallanthus sonchifolius]|uniref:Uncharacterized protein n=1 Tax=Smallanthus sonchifolius TaxID=185202 RepID=A0ACB8YL37_9ASTR|nr:hypothetical protein L1987_79646 [Smallanthus sonchifolius]